jgi:hypothetical protein
VSIIGCDRFSGGYNVAKVAQERAHLDGPIPAQILRAAQFHEFVGQLLEWGTQGDVADVPAMRTQLVAARNVAEALADLAITSDAAEPGSPIPEIAGPRVERLLDAARLLATRRESSAGRGDQRPQRAGSRPVRRRRPAAWTARHARRSDV